MIRSLKTASGGRLYTRLGELEEAGFITSLTPYGNKRKHTSYRLIDEYVGFYLKWIEPASKKILRGDSKNYWDLKSRSPGFRAWAGYTFEGICLKHSRQIRSALGIADVAVETDTWRHVPKKNSKKDMGAQIDLLFDREDGVITLCEPKYTNGMFQADKKFARDLMRKMEIFEQRTRTKKELFIALVTTAGLKQNSWSEDLIHQVVTFKDLFS